MSIMNNERQGNTSHIHLVMNSTHDELNNNNGGVRQLAIQKNTECDLCHGTGRKNGSDEVYEDCERCWGAGIVETYNKDTKQPLHKQCGECRGEGQTIILQNRCDQCKGKRFQQDRFILEVDIKKGKYCGKRIAYREEENQELNLDFGNLNIILDEIKHNQKAHNDDVEPSFA